MKILVKILIILLLALILFAKPISVNQIERATENWLSNFDSNPRIDFTIDRIIPFSLNGEIRAYSVILDGRGFCLCGADDMLMPVYLYCPEAVYEESSELVDYFLRSIADLNIDLLDAKANLDQRFMAIEDILINRSLYWENLITGNIDDGGSLHREFESFAEPDSMSLFQDAIWDQDGPFNDRCPALPTTTMHVLVGCNGISQAQIMDYWEWPIIGVGIDTHYYEHRYNLTWDTEPLPTHPGFVTLGGWPSGRIEYDTLTNELKMTGYWDFMMYANAKNFSDSAGYDEAVDSLWSRMTMDTLWYVADYDSANYDWARIKDSVQIMDSDDSAAVAVLCYHAAVSCISNFHIHVSTTNHGLVVSALEDHFSYHADAIFTNAQPTVEQMIDEILYQRPFPIGGCDTNGAGCHSWIVTGYDKSGAETVFKMNLGWQGRGNGWFVHDVVTTVGFDFAVNNHARMIAPNFYRFLGGDSSGDGTCDSPFMDMDDALGSVPSNATLIIKAGETAYFEPESIIVNTPMTIIGRNVEINQY